MITAYLLQVALMFISGLFYFFPSIEKLPNVPFLNVDVDTSLVLGVSYLKTLFSTFWVLQDVFYTFLAYLVYLLFKLTFKMLLGNRSPLH